MSDIHAYPEEHQLHKGNTSDIHAWIQMGTGSPIPQICQSLGSCVEV